MSGEMNLPFPVGTTRASTENPDILGQVVKFKDLDYSAGDTGRFVTTENSSRVVTAIVAKNGSGGTLTKRTLVSWDDDYVLRRIKGSAANNVGGAGFVDPHLSTTVADGEYFYLIVDGPCEAIHDGNDTIVKGNLLKGATGGKVDLFETGTDEGDTLVGVADETPADNNDGTTFKIIAQCKIPHAIA